MGLYNFQRPFVEKVREGIEHPERPDAKVQTVRSRREHRDAVGDTMHLYTGLRTAEVELLGRVPCVWTAEVEIYQHFSLQCLTIRERGRCWEWATDGMREQFAIRDGFASWAEMFAWFAETHKIAGAKCFVGDVFAWFDWRKQ
jgi:hypothetical protein